MLPATRSPPTTPARWPRPAAAYLRRLILGKEVKALPSQEIKALRTEVHKIGVNINQIARSVNAGIAKAEDARRGLYLLEQVYELMYEVAKK